MTKKNIAIVWFRNDLRLADNAALFAASQYTSILPLFIWDPTAESPWQAGAASQWWLHHSLQDLDKALVAHGSKLLIMQGDRLKIFEELSEKFKIDSVYWNRSYEPSVRIFDNKITKLLEAKGVRVERCRSNLIFEPGALLKSDGSPYKVYTAFWNTFLKSWQDHQKSVIVSEGKQSRSTIDRLAPLPFGAETLSLASEDLNLLPKIPWDSAFYKHWQPGESAAYLRLKNFIAQDIEKYQEQRDLPGVLGTSTLSPYLHFGQIHPLKIFHEIETKFGPLTKIRNVNIIQFCKELVWRDFAHHLLYFFPTLPQIPMNKSLDGFPWQKSKSNLTAWQKGMTGYPIVDAGMRQLWQTGWMHNRVRMIVASFLIKDLRITWQEGSRWFWDTLVDADLANNTQGWQWTAGCGFDSAPFFRIFNPTSQGEKFDPVGTYIKTWCPELSGLPQKWIHQPSLAPAAILSAAKVKLGYDYPMPIISHKIARDFTLQAYQKLKDSKKA